MWRLIASALGVLAFAAAIAGALWKAHDMGHEAGIAESAAVLAQWKASVVEQATARREAQQQRYRELQGEFDELRSRPERVRTVIETITVAPDDRCRDLPESWRVHWNAAADDSLRADPSAAASARLDDAGGARVADLTR